MPFWVYILECRDGTYYTGHTDNLEMRIAQHKTRIIPGYTSDRGPVKFLWSEEFPSRIEALERERQIKGWSRSKKEAFMRGDWDTISKLSKSHEATVADPLQSQDEREKK